MATAASVGYAQAATTEDLGEVDAATPLTGMVWLKGHDQDAFDAAVQSRFDPASSYYHRWMTAQEVAAYGPSASDVAALTASLKAQGLTVLRVSDDATAIKVAGTATKMQAAFGTSVHLQQAAGKSFLSSVGAAQYRGAHAELVDSVGGLDSVGAQPLAMLQADPTTGEPRAGIPAASTTNPLASFTSQCFGPPVEATYSHFALGGAISGDFIGPQYMPNIATMACGYTPQQIAAHYGLDAVYARGWTGKGQTIVIVDAYGSPTITNDANTFNRAMGLPALTNKNFSIVYPDGMPTATNSDWAVETSLDVEWAHGLAPDAKIVLVVAPTQDDAELAFAINYAASHRLGTVISNSFGEPEAQVGAAVAQQYNAVFKRAAAQGIAVNVATGDSGDFGVGTPLGAASIPADSPFATGIGGTSIDVPRDSGKAETVWGITQSRIDGNSAAVKPPFFQGFLQGTGGGESVYLAKPRYQRALPGTGRQLPDISAVADPHTGAIFVSPDASGQPVFSVVGGTSLATPVFSAIWALADQAAGQSLGQAGPVVAGLSPQAVTDIVPPIVTKAKDDLRGTLTQLGVVTTFDPAQLLNLEKTQPEGFVGTLVEVPALIGGTNLFDTGFGADSSLMATTGWDNATGWGVPNGLRFIQEAKRTAGGS